MPTEVEVASQETAKWYDIAYPATAYTFPGEALIHNVRVTEQYIEFELTDGRLLSVPLWWVPTVYNAAHEERQKFAISRDRKLVIWDPDVCTINDEVRIDDFLAQRGAGTAYEQ
jgi:hypothetical protein